MPNHYGHVVIARNLSGHEVLPGALREWATGLLFRLRPVPDPDPEATAKLGMEGAITPQWLDATIKAHGVKWDTYDISEPVLVPGDCFASQITFCTAWGPPNAEMMAMALADLARRGVVLMLWAGLDPYDDSTRILYIEAP